MVLASELFNVSDEVVLVTGGGTGMGFAMARALAVNGARLALAGNDPESLEAGVNASFWSLADRPWRCRWMCAMTTRSARHLTE
jgi:NAD(P)-dependent dehydrogenase (short-subunit alcohol dehydrogenase family)